MMPKPQGTARRVLKMLPVLLFALALILTWTSAWFVAHNLLDSDASSEMVLAHLLARQNQLLSTDWFYSNELRAAQTQLIFTPLFKILTDWHWVRFIGIVLLQTLLLLSYRYLCKRLKLSDRAFFLSAAILMMPYSVGYGRIVLFHTYYLPYVAFGFLLLGLYLGVLQGDPAEKPVRRRVRIALLLSVAFIASLNGLRQLMVTLVPLLGASAVLLFRPMQPGAQPQGASRWRGIVLALGAVLAGGCGYLVNTRVLANLYAFRQFNDVVLGLIEPENLSLLTKGYFAQFGFQAGRLLTTPEGLLACGGLLIALYALGAGYGALRMRSLAPDATPDWPGLLFATSLTTMLALFFFTRENANYLLYLIPCAVWVVPLLARRLDGDAAYTGVRKGLVYAVCACMLANGVYNNLFFIQPQGKAVDYEGISAPETDTVQSLQGVLAFLRENQYTLGYATFWNANVLTEASNGEIPMVNIILNESDMTATLYDWLSDRTLRDRDFVSRQKVFVLLKGDEDQLFLNTALSDQGEYVYEDEQYMIFSYETPTAPMDALLPAA